MALPAFSIEKHGDFDTLTVRDNSLLQSEITFFLPQIVQDAAAQPNLTNQLTLLRTTGAVLTGTLADGTRIGQLKTIAMIVDGGDYTLTPTNFLSGTTATFNDVGDTLTLVWVSGGTAPTTGWTIVSNNGVTIA